MTKVVIAIALEEPSVLFRTISDDHLVVIKIIIITMMMKNKLDVCVFQRALFIFSGVLFSYRLVLS